MGTRAAAHTYCSLVLALTSVRVTMQASTNQLAVPRSSTVRSCTAASVAARWAARLDG